MTQKLNTDNGLKEQRKERQHLAAPKINWRFSASYDSFVINQTLVLRIKFSGKNRQLLVVANRVCLESMSSTNIECFTKDGRQLK